MIPAPTPRLRKTRSASRAAVAVASAATGASWMALVAATTFGLGHFDRVRAAISADQQLLGEDDGQGYRLIVQSYDRANVNDNGLPSAHARPLGSTQRAVTAEELARGIEIDVMNVGAEPSSEDAPLLVAWIERGQPDLEFDARRARPSDDAFMGSSVSSDATRVVLRRRAA